ncbi:WD40 repeat protein [Pyrenophora tritici-repentis]|uniref:G-beta repeat n=2 Tax=Pyrenophora tritici-repentis TaxID=45151 RepID=A0A2W1FS54_9PLEO|nr:WD domain containing protein [Pyrenophora tritici-repentis Pt-1C-BFP]KAI1513974.1 G-beta repeat [Pyrenophora tritici-repentis]EDU48249.1 WD domain containing protein [Pyrenophora tritici-repentis Pt-1C-BFP]KAI1580463.1 WD40 repeat [Pyrenophora tritici-repentis]KAI1590927.1 WD40 repeat [Pyrenophora tritici-repentis]PWO23136.1 PlsC, 1-acyl-sn-glycerol-3-phosphate acyltransferase [Pyrenophora tritici-repentis]
MSLTPSSSRVSPAIGSGIKLNPSPSPFFKTALRSPVKAGRAEANLALRQVIGTTTNSPNAFDSLPSGSTFGYTAGAAAVIASIDDQGHVTQRFYRARPTTNPINPSASIYGGPSTPTQNESRNRTTLSLRDPGLGASPLPSPGGQDWADSPSNRAWTMKDKIKAATCVSFSPDAKYFAVGETGYKPRVLIFSAAPDAPSDTPLTSLSDHTFGVNCVAFSPDSRFLASLGSSNDGFLYIWHINPRTGAATLHASNKCVSHIHRIAWMGNKLVTVGVRHVKVWKVDDLNAAMRFAKARQSDTSFISGSTHKTLPGRNCILEGLKESTFTSVVAIARDKAIVASDKGDICLIDNSDSDHRFFKLVDAGFSVSSLAVDVKGRLHIAGSQGALKTLIIKDIIGRLTPPPSPPPRVESPTVSVTDCNQIGVIACLKDYVVTVDSQRAIRLSQLCSDDDESVVGNVVHTLPAHGNAVLGVHAGLVRPNVFDASYYTWAADGTVIFWHQGSFRGSVEVPLEQLDDPDAVPNELRTVRTSTDASFLVAGDKFGVLRFIDCTTKACLFQFKAHASEITSIAIHEEKLVTSVACASRDRTVQVFTRMKGKWDLLQTLDEHVGAVNGVSFSRDGTRLVSTSSDRSLVVRELLSLSDSKGMARAFAMSRAIMLKATPVSSAWDVDQDDAIFVSTIDRQVHKFDVRTGQCLSNLRACDTDGGDAVVISSLVHVSRGWGTPLIAGVSSTDKSIRVYDEAGSLVARDWGHTEGVSDIALVQSPGAVGDDGSEKSLVTVAVDGTIFVWTLGLTAPNRQELSKSMDLLAPNTPSNQELLSNKPPLRRVLSQSEMARFQRSPQETEAGTPTGNKSPKLRKKVSKFSLASTPKLDPSPLPGTQRESRSAGQGSSRKNKNPNRSPSPPSPRSSQQGKRRASVDARARTKAPVREFGSIGQSTESLCRTLRSYRKRLANTTEDLSSELAKEVERELAATARAIGDRVKTKAFEETIMIKLLDQYSERLVNMLDEKIAASVAQRVRESSVGNFSDAESPAVTQGSSRSRRGSGSLRDTRADDSESGTDAFVESTENLTIE